MNTETMRSFLDAAASNLRRREHADVQALVDEAIRSHRSLRGKDIRSISKTRWITSEDHV